MTTYENYQILITGGKANNNTQLNSWFVIDSRINSVKSASNMIVSKRSHTLANLNNRLIYWVGGYNSL